MKQTKNSKQRTAVLERLCSRLNLTAEPEEDPKVEKIQFDLDTGD